MKSFSHRPEWWLYTCVCVKQKTKENGFGCYNLMLFIVLCDSCAKNIGYRRLNKMLSRKNMRVLLYFFHGILSCFLKHGNKHLVNLKRGNGPNCKRFATSPSSCFVPAQKLKSGRNSGRCNIWVIACKVPVSTGSETL